MAKSKKPSGTQAKNRNGSSKLLSKKEWSTLTATNDAGIRKRAEETRAKFQSNVKKLASAETDLLNAQKAVETLKRGKKNNRKAARRLMALAQELEKQQQEKEAARSNLETVIKRESADEDEALVKIEPNENKAVFKTEPEESSESESDSEGSVVIKAEGGMKIKAEPLDSSDRSGNEDTAPVFIKTEPEDNSEPESNDDVSVMIKAEDGAKVNFESHDSSDSEEDTTPPLIKVEN